MEEDIMIINDTDKCSGVWTRSRNEQQSIVDYCLVPKNQFHMIEGMHIDEDKELPIPSDHNMILLTINCNPHRIRRQTIQKEKWDISEHSNWPEFRRAINQKILEADLDPEQIPTLCTEHGVDHATDTITRIISEAATEHIGLRKIPDTSQRQKPNKEIRGMIGRKRTISRVKRQLQKVRAHHFLIQRARNQVQLFKTNIASLKKRKWQEKCVKLATKCRQDRSKKFLYRWINKNKKQHRVNINLRDPEGTILTDPDDIGQLLYRDREAIYNPPFLKRRKVQDTNTEHDGLETPDQSTKPPRAAPNCDHQYSANENYTQRHDQQQNSHHHNYAQTPNLTPSTGDRNQEDTLLTTDIDDINWTILVTKLKNDKASGQDGIVSEFLKYGGTFLQEIITALFN